MDTKLSPEQCKPQGHALEPVSKSSDEPRPNGIVYPSAANSGHNSQLTVDTEKAIKPSTEPLQQETIIPKAPDGGLQAWLQVLGGFIIYFNTWYSRSSRALLIMC